MVACYGPDALAFSAVIKYWYCTFSKILPISVTIYSHIASLNKIVGCGYRSHAG